VIRGTLLALSSTASALALTLHKADKESAFSVQPGNSKKELLRGMPEFIIVNNQVQS
jgi:hypothetical protein